MKKILFLQLILFASLSNHAQSLLAYYPFNGNANDVAGTLNGTVSGAVLTTDRYTISNNAYSFDGINDYINLGNASIIRPTAGLTISLWFELNASGALNGRNMISCTENGGYNIQYYQADQTVRALVRRNGVYAVVQTPALPYNNTGWHFACLTFDGRYTKLYLDGLLVDVDDAGATYPITYTANNTYIGAEPTTGSGIDGNNYYKGKMDELKIYNSALNAVEIANEYNNNPHPIPNVGLKLWLRADTGVILNGNAVSQWSDISGNGQHAFQTNSAAQPLLLSNELNAKPVLRFDGINDILKTATLNLTNTQNATVFIVNKATNEAISLEQSSDVNLNANGFHIYENYNNIGLSAALKGNAAGPFNNFQTLFKSNLLDTNYKITYVAYDKSQSNYLNQIKVRVDGMDITNSNGYGGSHSDNFNNDSLFIGGRGTGSSFMKGDIAEVIIYNRSLTDAERIQVENYLNQLYNTSSTLVQSKPGSGNAIGYDGINDYTSIPSPNFTAYTIEAWVKFTGLTTNKNIMVFTNSSGTGSAWSHQIRTSSGGKFEHYTYDGSGNTVIGTTTINQNQWYHVCITASNAGTAKLYVNGIQEGSPAALGNLWTSGTEFRIGQSTGGGAGYFSGQVDEIRVWNKELTPEQIRWRMCRKITSNDSLYAHLIVNLNCDEVSGNIAYDASPNARNGALINGPTRLLSGASIGNTSAYNYAGALSSVYLSNAILGDFTATLNSGNASGIHIYQVNDKPNTRLGIDSLSSHKGYFGVFIPNGIGNTYIGQFHYLNNGGLVNENNLILYHRNHNADTLWTNAMATLNTDSNTLNVTGQNTEYIIGGLYIPATYYHDADGDGYGSMLDSIVSFSLLTGYVTNHLDCNDNDSLEHPGQLWFIDTDHDSFAGGSSMVQCARPLNGFVASELTATSGDCNDNNASIYPNYQHFEFSSIGDYSNAVINPTNGDSYTTFNFEVVYKDASGAFPTPTFPRVLLDYEGNGIYNNTNDRVLFMSEDDVNDINTVDGKKYTASINGLPTGTNWKTFIQTNVNACGSNFGPFNYPDVLVRPDLEIFANDITFSNPHPAISSPLTISAEVHNVSDFNAQNFIVHLKDQYNPSVIFPDITIAHLASHATTTVSWNLTTIATPSWHPMEVSIDYSNSIAESNELDNVALRPYINGNYNLPGSIVTSAFASPSVSYQSSGYVSLSGSAHYSGTAVPLIDSSVAGATISFTIVETGANFTTHTNSSGNFSYSFPKPLPVGLYHIIGTCTDYTLTGNLSAQFEIIPPINNPICTLPNLITEIYTSSNAIMQGDSVSGTLVVKNVGQSASIPTQFSIAQSGGLPLLAGQYVVPSLAPNASFSIPFNITFNAIGQYSLCGMADANYEVSECSENNSLCTIINVFPPLPDIIPTNGPIGSGYQCKISQVGFELRNYGGLATGQFNCRVITKHNGNVVNTFDQIVPNIIPIQYSPANVAGISVPFTPAVSGIYTFEIYADFPLNEVVELNELNNNATYTLSVIACKPDFSFLGCENFNVESSDGNYNQGSNVTVKAKLINGGNLGYNGNLTVRFGLSSGGQYDTTVNVNLAPSSTLPMSMIITAPAPATTLLTVTADPFNLINESNEADNSISNQMCWDFQPVPFCSHNFWDENYLINQTVDLAIGVRSSYLYDADTLKVKFQVSGPGLNGTIDLGEAIAYNFKQTCYCPSGPALPISFAFPQTGTYTFIMTVDPNNEFTECNESNNVLIKTVNVTNLPDMRILSQYIQPSKLNPDPNEPITMNITYENIGASNINDQMKLRVMVNNTSLDSIYPLNGLVHNGNATVSIPNSWSSNLVGAHIIRAIIDDDDQVNETNEVNNEATRAIIVGESANLYFQALTPNTYTPDIYTPLIINTRIGNSGDLSCAADVQFFFVDDNLDSLLIDTKHITVAAHDSSTIFINWNVLDAKTTIIAKIVNASILEYTYDDNESNFKIGDLRLALFSEPYCNYGAGIGTAGYIHASVFGGDPPYFYDWNTGSHQDFIAQIPGTYTLTATDITGQFVSGTATIDSCSDIFLTTELFIQGYYDNVNLMEPVLTNQGIYTWSNLVDSVIVELHKDSIGYPLIATFTGLLTRDGKLKAYFNSPNLIGTSSYIVIKHRNALETWSSTPIIITPTCSYTFFNAAAKAYGNNMVQMAGASNQIYALYSGDFNRDENIDLLDFSELDNDISLFLFGYLATDLNGDGNVDLLDGIILEGNVNNFIFATHP